MQVSAGHKCFHVRIICFKQCNFLVTELLCLATWREGSNKYLVGIMSDAERKAAYDAKYYCFIYSEQRNRTHLIYQISQSADQNCNDIQSDREGDVIMRLISSK